MGHREDDQNQQERRVDDDPEPALVQVDGEPVAVDRKAVEGLVGQSGPKDAPPATGAASPKISDHTLVRPVSCAASSTVCPRQNQLLINGAKRMAAITPSTPSTADVRRTRAWPMNMLAPATTKPMAMAMSAVRVCAPTRAAPAARSVNKAVRPRTDATEPQHDGAPEQNGCVVGHLRRGYRPQCAR